MTKRLMTEDVLRLMKRCQVGVGGRNALDNAHDIMAECYGTLGALVAERDSLLNELAICADMADEHGEPDLARRIRERNG